MSTLTTDLSIFDAPTHIATTLNPFIQIDESFKTGCILATHDVAVMLGLTREQVYAVVKGAGLPCVHVTKKRFKFKTHTVMRFDEGQVREWAYRQGILING